MDFKIRKVTNNDYNNLWKLYADAFERSEKMKRYYNMDAYIAFFEKNGYAYLAESDEICGVILAYDTPDVFCGVSLFIDLIAVKKKYQKNGIGSALINQIIQIAKESGISEVSLRTACYLDTYQMYKNMGFHDTRGDLRYMVMNIENSNKYI